MKQLSNEKPTIRNNKKRRPITSNEDNEIKLSVKEKLKQCIMRGV